MSKILVIEDEENISKTLKYNLSREGYEVLVSADGRQGLQLAQEQTPDLVILDLILPGINGLDICRVLRKQSTVPIIILTCKEDEVSKILGLELGADDYITKPFSLPELKARIRALLRRMNMLVDYRPASTQISEENKDPVPLYPVEVLRVGNLQIDLKKHIVTADARVVHLTPMEYELLLFFIRHEGQVLSREKLLEGVWDSEGTNSSRTIDVHIRWLREKIEPDPARPRYIHTVYGIGYKFEPEQAATRFTK